MMVTSKTGIPKKTAVAFLVVCMYTVQVNCVISYDYSRYPAIREYYRPRLPVVPLAVLADTPYSIAKSSVNVPLIIVPQRTLQTLYNPHIKAISPTQPLVTCQTSQYITDATPAVKIVLKKPLYVETPASTIPFPSYMSILHEGLRMNIPVGMLIAPVPEYGLSSPHFIRYVYAVPTSPLPLQYPYYPSPSYSQPELPLLPYAPLRPVPLYHQHQQQTINYIPDVRKPPLITVLDFPSAIATPETLYYQRPADPENELGNRGPPEAVPPSGIIQSAAPQSSLQAFLNSKESVELQALRDEALKNKNNPGVTSVVEAL